MINNALIFLDKNCEKNKTQVFAYHLANQFLSDPMAR